MISSMQVVKASLLLSFALVLSGCVLSREPFYTGEVIIAPPKLAGLWNLVGKDGSIEENEFWRFEDNKARAYDQRGQWRSLTITYFKVNDVTFADTIADGPGDDITSSEGYRSLHQVPFHMVSRVERNGDRFILRPLLTREFSQATRDRPIASWMVQTDYETTVFNASSADWVEFLKRHGKDGGLFSEESQLVFLRQTDQ